MSAPKERNNIEGNLFINLIMDRVENAVMLVQLIWGVVGWLSEKVGPFGRGRVEITKKDKNV